MKPVSTADDMQKKPPPPPTCFFATAIFSPPIKVLGGFIKCLPPLLALYSNLQFWFSPNFFLGGLPRLLLHRIKVMMMSHLLLFLLHQRFTYWHKKKNISVLYGSLPSLGFSQSAMQCVFFACVFFCTCVRRRKNGTRSITKVHTGVWEGWSFSHLTTFGHHTHTHKEPPLFSPLIIYILKWF